ncbi:hypothetical protein MAHJHV55_52450 [Mycobacterium avium subsp. hominissuis]
MTDPAAGAGPGKQATRAWSSPPVSTHGLVACFPGPAPAGWRIIGRVLDGPARVLVDEREWSGPAGRGIGHFEITGPP